MTARLLLVDDHELFTTALTALLTPRFEVVGVAQTLDGAVAAMRRLRPDLVLLDMSLAGTSGLQVATALRAVHGCPPLLALSMHEEPELAVEFLRRGGAGYLLKRASAVELVEGIEEALAGRPVLAEALREEAESGGALTDRQREVLRLLATGRPMRAIAADLGISPKTVEYHKYAMMAALGFRTTADLVAHAVQLGLRPHQAEPPPG